MACRSARVALVGLKRLTKNRSLGSIETSPRIWTFTKPVVEPGAIRNVPVLATKSTPAAALAVAVEKPTDTTCGLVCASRTVKVASEIPLSFSATVKSSIVT